MHDEISNMHRIEIGALGLTIGSIPIIGGFLAGWWLSIPFVPESQIFLWAMLGLGFGGLIDVVFLRSWLRRAYSIAPLVWISIYLFYSVCFFGFFMGVPIFNMVLSVPAGFFVGARLARSGVTLLLVQKTALRLSMFTTSVLTLACVASAYLALADPHTGANLEGMLGLSFPVTVPMIIGLILVGGFLILAIQWRFTNKSVEWTYRYFARVANPQ